MKNLIIIILVLGLLSCSREIDKRPESNKYVHIQGRMDHGEAMNLIFHKVVPYGKESLDTVTINKYDEFELHFPIDKTGFYQLSNEGGNSITLLCSPGDSIKLEANYYNFREYSLSGSKDLEAIERLNSRTQKFLYEIGEYSRIIQDSVNSKDYSSIRLEIDKKYRSSFDRFKAFSEEFILENENSLVSLLALNNQLGENFFVFHPLKDFVLYKRLDSILMQKYPEEESVRNLHNQLMQIKNNENKKKDAILNPGDKIPVLSLKNPEEKKISLSDFQGKILLIDFWASWCNECMENNVGLIEIYEKFHPKGLEIIQISIDNSKQKWIDAIKKQESSWIHLSDLKFWESEAVKQFRIESIPYNFLINENGEIISLNLDLEKLETELNYIFGK